MRRRRKIASTCDCARLGAMLVLLERERRELSRRLKTKQPRARNKQGQLLVCYIACNIGMANIFMHYAPLKCHSLKNGKVAFVPEKNM